jgi:hypothetical protein
MKTFIFILSASILSLTAAAQENVGIGTSSPNSKALLDLTSTSKGFLMPRMTYEDRTAISSPPAGLMVYQTNSIIIPTSPSGIYFYHNNAWKRIARSDEVTGGGGSSGWTIVGDDQYHNLAGNVGIGISAPTSRLHLEGNFLQENGNYYMNTPSGILQFQTNGDNKAYVQLSGNNLRMGTNMGNSPGSMIIRMDGVDRIVIDSLGDMGIGTLSPHASAKLDVGSTSRGVLFPRMTTSQRFTINSPANGLLVYDTDKNEFHYHHEDGWKSILNNDYWSRPITTRDRIANTADSIGIGTTSPIAKLHITNGSYADYTTHNGHIMLGSASEQNLVIGHYEILARDNGAPSPLFLQHDGGVVRLGSGGLAATTKLHITDGTFANLAQHGHVVIGETSGVNMVIDENEIQARNNGGANTLYLQRSGGLLETGGPLHLEASGVTGQILKLNGTDPNLGFYQNGSYKSFISLTGNLLWIQSNAGKIRLEGSQIAIGAVTDDADDYKLAVAGKAICEELRVEMVDDWPDYVFAKDYKLTTLSELKDFIEKNHHLPNIPKASEIHESGLDVGEMNRKLMEKVEELTLYVIKLQEQIDELKAGSSGSN